MQLVLHYVVPRNASKIPVTVVLLIAKNNIFMVLGAWYCIKHCELNTKCSKSKCKIRLWQMAVILDYVQLAMNYAIPGDVRKHWWILMPQNCAWITGLFTVPNAVPGDI